MFIPKPESNKPGGRPYNGAKAIPYAVGLTPCEGPEVFSQGEEFNPDLPPQEYDERGLAICCANMMNVRGGVLLGGVFVLDWLPAYTPTVCVFPPDQPNPTDVIVTIPAGFNGTVIVSVPDGAGIGSVVRNLKVDLVAGAQFFLETRYSSWTNCAVFLVEHFFSFASYPYNFTAAASPGHPLGQVKINTISPAPHTVQLRIRVVVS